jgi:hypothetical protein
MASRPSCALHLPLRIRSFVIFGSPLVQSGDENDEQSEELKGVEYWESLALGVVGSYDPRSLANLRTEF